VIRVSTTTKDCGCPEYRAATAAASQVPSLADGLSRRGVLRGMLAGAALGVLSGVATETVNSRYAFGAEGYAGDVLVVLSLRGGMDGLNVVVPHGDPAYLEWRPTIGIPAGALLERDAMFGLHPALAPLAPFWRAGTFGAVHAVGQASPTRSHFEAMAQMERAAPGSSIRTGWLDRTIGLREAGTAFQATTVGSTRVPALLSGPSAELSLRGIDHEGLAGAWDSTELTRWTTALSSLHKGWPAAVATPAAVTLKAAKQVAALKDAGYTPAAGAVYPKGDLGDALRDVARLIKAGVGLQVATVDYGDWDMHAGMGTPDAGWLTSHLGELARAMAAFATDLGPAGMGSVTLVTQSEFGRRVGQNGSGGVDHGHGNAVLLLGGSVVGGRVHGVWPGLESAALVDGDLAGTTDYRGILAEILQKRCGAGDVSTVFPGLASTHPGVVRARA
jgi:uncharacterized protein (DUF1501 family)